MSETFESSAGETSGTGPLDGHAAGGTADSSESQDNAIAGAGQPNAAEPSSRWPAIAPWVALGVVLAFELAAVSYEQSQEWGFLGNLELVFVIAGVGLATTLWLATWLLYSTWPLWGRTAYFAVGLASLAAVTSPTIPWWEGEWDLTVWLVVVVIGVWLVQFLSWRHGWRIGRAASTDAVAAAPWLRFSISDLLVLTTGIAILLGLILARGEFNRFAVALVGAQIAAGSLVLWIALTWKHYAPAIGASFLCVVLVSVAAMLVSDPGALVEPSALILSALYAGPATTSALVIIAIVRSAGYRMRA